MQLLEARERRSSLRESDAKRIHEKRTKLLENVLGPNGKRHLDIDSAAETASQDANHAKRKEQLRTQASMEEKEDEQLTSAEEALQTQMSGVVLTTAETDGPSNEEEGMETKENEEDEEKEPELLPISSIRSSNISKSMKQLETIMIWSQYHLKNFKTISEETADKATTMWAHLRSAYLILRPELIEFEVPENIYIETRTPALVWFATMSQLLFISRKRELTQPDVRDWCVHSDPDLFERIQCINSEPIIRYTLRQCMSMFNTLLADLSENEPIPSTFKLFELLELRISMLMCFLHVDTVLDDPRYATTVNADTRQTVLNTRFLVDTERLVFNLALLFTVHTQLHAEPLSTDDDERKQLDLIVAGFERWSREFASKVIKTGAATLRPDFRDAMMERTLFPHERETVKMTKLQAEQRHMNLDALTILQMSRDAILNPLIVTIESKWTDIIGNHIKPTRPVYTEVVLQFVEYYFNQRMSHTTAGAQKYSFCNSNFIRLTWFYQAALLYWFSNSKITETQDWRERISYPVIFDFRPYPIAYLPSQGLSRKCPDIRYAFAQWAVWMGKFKKFKLHNGISIEAWYNTLLATATELADVKTRETVLPICELPPDIMKQWRDKARLISADKLAHQIEVDAKERKRAEEDSRKAAQQSMARLAEQRRKEKADEKKYYEQQRQSEQTRQQLIQEKIIKRKKHEEQERATIQRISRLGKAGAHKKHGKDVADDGDLIMDSSDVRSDMAYDDFLNR